MSEYSGADPEIFQKGGWGGKCLLIQVSTCVHIKTRQTCKSFSLLPFQEDCPLFFALFYNSLLFFKFERGVATPCNPPPDSPMLFSPISGRLRIGFMAVTSAFCRCTMATKRIRQHMFFSDVFLYWNVYLLFFSRNFIVFYTDFPKFI